MEEVVSQCEAGEGEYVEGHREIRLWEMSDLILGEVEYGCRTNWSEYDRHGYDIMSSFRIMRVLLK
jgi:hypothetical protein